MGGSVTEDQAISRANIRTWSIPSMELCMTWFLKLLAQALTLQSHQQKSLLMGLLVQSSPCQQQKLPSNPRLPPPLLQLPRFPPRSILFGVFKPLEIIKRKVKVKIKNLETKRRIQNQPPMIMIKGKEKKNIHVYYVEGRSHEVGSTFWWHLGNRKRTSEV